MTPAATVRHLLGDRPSVPGEAGESFASANIALVKYWGKRDAALNLPVTSSLSVSLGGKGTRARLAANGTDTLTINGAEIAPEAKEFRRMFAFLDLLRPAPDFRFRLDTTSTIPMAAGLASSASAFASVVMAADRLFGWGLPARDLSVLARMGSGSASRSLFRGFVQWHAGARADGLDSFAEPVAADWPDFRIGVLKLSSAEKKTGSRDGMNRTVAESPLYAAWPALVARDLEETRAALAARDFTRLGRAAERNALAMHGTMLGCFPAVLYWLPESVAAIRRVMDAREAGVPVYLTMDAGPNVKLLFPVDAESAVREWFPALDVINPFAD